MSDETGEDVKSRFARRFDDEQGSSDKDEPASKEGKVKTERNAMNSVTEKKSKKAKNVKKEWNAKSVYLPDELNQSLSRAYKKLDWQLDEDEGISIKKTRHYYPLVVMLGVEQLESMESTEVKERLESMESKEQQ